MNAFSASNLLRVAGAGVIAGTMALSVPTQASTVDFVNELKLDGMSTGICAGIICPIPFGTVTVTGDTTSTLSFSIALEPDVSFSTGDAFWFDLTAEGNPITFTLGAPTAGWVTPFSTGSFIPAPGADFPGPYTDLVRCTAAGSTCGTELNFTASGADAADPFVFGAPLGAGNFADISVVFVGNLSIAPNTALCPEATACTGLVGAPEPSTWAMILAGFAGLGWLARQRTRRLTAA